MLLFFLLGAAVSASVIKIAAIYPDSRLGKSDVLYLRGAGVADLNWNKGIAMSHSGANVWTATLTAASKDVGTQLQVKALINDATWMKGSNAMTTILSSDFSFPIYPWFGNQGGSVYLLPNTVYSPQLQNSRQIALYIPPSYSENTLKPQDNVLIMHDGNNLFTASLCSGCCPFGCWNIAPTLDQYIIGGFMQEVFVIGVFNTQDRMNEYTYSRDPNYSSTPKGNLYLDFLEQTVLPLIAKSFRVAPQPPALGILGSSLGGLISCYAGVTRPKVYPLTGCMSPSLWWNNQDFNTTVLPPAGPPPPGLFWLDAGSAESQIPQATATARDHMEALGKHLGEDLFFYLDPGAQHSETYWGRRFWRPMVHMFPGSETPPKDHQQPLKKDQPVTA